jgi:signal transduction histidine kinase
MATVAATAGAGDLSVRAGSVGGRDEVAALARGFNQMLVRLQRAFARQRQFVDDASHELRTPLAVARVQVELLDRETDPARRHQANGTLLRRLDEIDHLIGDMLTLASADGGTLIEPEPIDLVGFFADLSRDLPLFGDRDYRVLGVSGTLEADPRRLTQVIRNLIRNAVDHTHAGDLIELCARVEGDRLRITVSDAGPGIPPEQLERVFERFHRLEHSRSHATGGTGLGLPIARAIVEAHGGTIWARSTSGHGATFQFELPGYRPPAAGITLDDSSVLPAGST